MSNGECPFISCIYLAAILEMMGHDVTAIAHDHPHALKDHEVLSIARDEERILITNDRDFGELIFRQRLDHAGVILFRLGDEELPTKTAWLEHILVHYEGHMSHFIVVTERGVRVRRTDPH
jgi:predicted nuclease of predicted toxin-antitoxin system